MIEVVSGVIVRRGRILLTQRRAMVDHPFCWETPGGKLAPIDAGRRWALLRELQEELGIMRRVPFPDARIGKADIFTAYVSTTQGDAAVSFFEVQIRNEEPTPCEGQGIGWFTFDEMRRLTLAPGNAKWLATMGEQLEELLNNAG